MGFFRLIPIASVGPAVGAGFALVLLLIAGVTATGLGYMARVTDQLKQIVQVNDAKIELARSMQRSLRERAMGMHAIPLERDPFLLDEEVQRIAAFERSYIEARERLMALADSTEEIAVLNRIRALTPETRKYVNAAIELGLRHEYEAMNAQMRDFALPGQRRMSAELDTLISLLQKRAFQATDAATAAYGKARLVMTSLGFLAIGVGALVAFFVVRRVSAQAKKLEEQAHFDPLTSLPNRRLLLERLAQAISEGTRHQRVFSLLLMDLDRFKDVNDTLGHSAGDLLLQQVGNRLMRYMRQTDTVARLGGDEYAILLPNTEPLQAFEIATRVLQTLGDSFELDGEKVKIEASIGIAVFPDHGQEVNLLIQHADVAMYGAKATGNRCAFYDAELDKNSRESLTLKGELQKAIEREELQLFFQPKIGNRSGKIEGVEALVRWRHPVRGFLPPDQFIPMAEKTGLINPLTHWVLKRAMMECGKLRARGFPLRVSVNLSTRNLQDERLADTIEALLDANHIEPALLSLEITESAMMADPRQALVTMTRLAKRGVQFSVDDFGTGYSSLAYLKKLPVRELKIDKSFVMDMVDDENDAMIVRSTIELAHNLGLAVVAEGIETGETWALLTALGCDAAQGYYMSPPLPVDQLIAWMVASPWGIGPQAAVG